jgi:P-type Ca2+ transporter type 2C
MTPEKFVGLTDSEVTNNRTKYGTNALVAETKNRFLGVIKDIVLEPLFIILICSAVIYGVLGAYSEGIVMVIALAIVAGIGIYQENKSRSAVDALKKLSAPHAKVIRNGDTMQITTDEIVVEDIVVVEEGTIVPADATILELHDFSVNESILTGEALAVIKNTTDADTLFQGTIATSGSCVARVTAVGGLTALGKIGASLEEIEVPKTPLQLQIKSFVRSMVSVGVVAFLIVWAVNYYLSKSILHGLLHGLTIAMSVLPEEIPVSFSTFMALGAYHLFKRKVIAKNPHTVETLGATTVICTDKTGTITENKMQLSCIYNFSEDKTHDYTTEAFGINRVLEYAMWASEITPFDMMEKSLHEVYTSVAKPDRRTEHQFIHEYPLSGKPPFMTHVFSDRKSSHIIACKGSVEGVLKQCKLSVAEKKKIEIISSQFSSKGFRVLAVAKSDHDIEDLPLSQHDFEFEFIGLVGFYDPPKKNIEQLLKTFYAAGINVKMITGDHAETAVTIANQVHLKNSAEVLTGTEVMEMNDLQLRKKVSDVNIYARMFPEAKLRVIEALKANGEIVAMTGDGVNDGPALKAAHIGIAMGMGGSEIAKNAASLIIMDDDLSHMAEAVALGRRIYENLKKAIRYIISIHIPIILIVTIPLVLMWKFTDIFSPVHVIFLELIMGPTCSIIFENEPIEQNSMTKPPREVSATFFSLRELLLSIIQGLIITTGCLGLGYYFMITDHNQAEVRTMIYTTLIFSNVFLTLVTRSFYYSIFTTIQYKNRLVPAILTASLIVLFCSIYVPFARNIFEFSVLKPMDIALCIGTAFFGVIWVEIYKMWKRRTGKQINSGGKLN